MDLQDAIDRFLADAERQRSAVTVRRYGEAMDLFQSYLALERMDPDDPAAGGPETLDAVTPESVAGFVQSFLAERFGENDRAFRRYVAATRAFVGWLERSGCVDRSAAAALQDALRGASRRIAPAPESEDGDGGERAVRWEGSGWEPIEEGESVLQVLEVDPQQNAALLVNVVTGEEVSGGDLPRGETILPGDLVAGRVVAGRAGSLRLLMSLEDLDDELDDGDEEDEPDDAFSWSDSGPVAEYALEILSSEDRYAPREVVEAIVANIEDAQDELMEWLVDDEYRNEPLPGTGEAPANAARILSEVRHEEAIPRLLAVLGDRDPLGEEAPAALGRYGVQVLGRLQEIAADRAAGDARRAGAIWALATVAARNPAWRGDVVTSILEALEGASVALLDEGLDALEELRAVEGLPEITRRVQEGALDLEATGRTLPLVQSRIRSEGIGDRLAESMLPIVFLYPTSDELEEFYESIEEDLGGLWDEEDGEDLEDEHDSEHGTAASPPPGDTPAPSTGNGGKVLPFRRPTS